MCQITLYALRHVSNSHKCPLSLLGIVQGHHPSMLFSAIASPNHHASSHVVTLMSLFALLPGKNRGLGISAVPAGAVVIVVEEVVVVG